jgi:hypothetical protein
MHSAKFAVSSDFRLLFNAVPYATHLLWIDVSPGRFVAGGM